MASTVENTPGNAISETLNFKNVPRCLGPQELVPLARVPKPPTIHYQPTTSKLFDSPNNMLLYGSKSAQNFSKTSKFLSVEFSTRQINEMMIG